MRVVTELLLRPHSWRARPPGCRAPRPASRSGEREHRVLAGTLAVPVLDVDGDDLAGPISSNRIFSESWSSISRWMVRRSGRAPSTGSKPRLASSDLALSVSSIAMSLALQLLADPADHQVDHLDDLVLGQLVEDDDVVDAVEELRAEVLLQLVVDLLLHPLVVVLAATLGEAEPDRLGDVGRAQVRGEDQHGVLEVDRAALTVGEPAVLEHLQQACCRSPGAPSRSRRTAPPRTACGAPSR